MASQILMVNIGQTFLEQYFIIINEAFKSSVVVIIMYGKLS